MPGRNLKSRLVDLRQWGVPSAFYIPEAEGDLGIAELIRKEEEQLVALLGATNSDSGAADTVAELSSSLWLIRKKVLDMDPDGSPSFRLVRRHLDAAFDVLRRFDIRIDDHKDEFVTGGERFSVLAIQPTEGLDRDRVIETIKPTIYRGKTILQAGQVVVGTPRK